MKKLSISTSELPHWMTEENQINILYASRLHVRLNTSSDSNIWQVFIAIIAIRTVDTYCKCFKDVTTKKNLLQWENESSCISSSNLLHGRHKSCRNPYFALWSDAYIVAVYAFLFKLEIFNTIFTETLTWNFIVDGHWLPIPSDFLNKCYAQLRCI